VPGEFELTAADFARIGALLREETGIHLPASKATLVYSRLAKRLRALGLKNFRDYCNLIVRDEGAQERQRMFSALTTNVTRFFREEHHFHHLASEALPSLLMAAKRGARVRLWSAGCSTGQEPYSMALTILSEMPDAASFDIKVLATDINPDVIAHGRSGIYLESALQDVPTAIRSRWFVPASHGRVQVADELRALVAFRELNLTGAWPMHGPFQVIFCRNVVIYFDEETQANVWSRTADILAPGGWLYIGHSERIASQGARGLTSAGVTTYRKHDGARP
jgi:chemotaxis protein methyltransferase CheR